MFDFRDYGNGIVAFDAGYVRPILAAIHMVVDGGRVAFIDTGTNASLENVFAALQRVGLGPEAVDFVILTHVHLDHAGGAGVMMRAFPQARLVVHPRGARHMVEPSKLVAGVCAVYGEDHVRRMYGEILPVEPARILEASDESTVRLGSRELRFLDTPGHARHHICIVDTSTGGIFSGDMFGLSYREMDVGGRQFIFPTTTPSQFDPDAMHKSVDRLLALSPEAIYLTHYGRINDAPYLGGELQRRLDAHVAIALQARGLGSERHGRIRTALAAYLGSEAEAYGSPLSVADLLALWETDLELNAQGLGIWLDTLESH